MLDYSKYRTVPSLYDKCIKKIETYKNKNIFKTLNTSDLL